MNTAGPRAGSARATGSTIPHRMDQTALYLERFMNYGITPDELRSGRPIVGIAQSGSDLSPCNRHHLELAQRVRDGIRDARRHPDGVPRAPDQRELPQADRRARPQPLLPGARRDPLRLLHRRRGAYHRLRQDDAGRDHGRLDRGHPGHRALRRADARRLLRGRARRLGHGDLEEPAPAGRRPDRRGGVLRDGAGLRAFGGPLQHHGYGLDHERPGRGARPLAARVRGHPRALPRARPDGLRDGQAHRRDGLRGPAPFEDPDARGVPERDRRHHRHRRIDQRPAAHHGHGAPRRRRDQALRLGARLRRAAARQHAAGRRVPGRALPPRRRRARGGQRASAGRQDRRRRR